MILQFLLFGIIIGVFTALPAGPASVLCVYRTLNKSWMSGYMSGLGAASADAVFSGIAGFGVTIILQTILEYQLTFKILATIVLFGLAVRLFFFNPYNKPKKEVKTSKKGYFGDYISTMGLTLSNPMGIFGFAAVFAGFNIVEDATVFSIILLILGVVLGAAMSWFFIISLIHKFKKKISVNKLFLINKIAGIIVFAFGIGVVVSIF